MNKKKLIFCYVLQILALATMVLLMMPLVKNSGLNGAVMGLLISSEWIMIEDYLFAIAGIITVVTMLLLLISLELYKLCACGVIKNKIFDRVLYIINIVLISFAVATIVNYFLGLGRTTHMSGLHLFQGETLFKYATPVFYLHCVFTITMLVLAILCKNKKKS